MHKAVSCDGICLDPSHPRTAGQAQRAGDVEEQRGGGGRREERWDSSGGNRDRERRRQCPAEKQHRHDSFNWEGNFRNETMGKLGITAREKCVKQVVRLHRSAVNRLSECECEGVKGAKVVSKRYSGKSKVKY